MAKTLELKRRIRSIGKTRQITRTMEMVSTSKLKRATDRVHAARPYAARLTEVIGHLIDPELRERYPLLRQPETVRRAAVILVTSNRGLAGAFNVNLIREARRLIERLRGAGVEVEIHVVGKKAVSFFRYQKEELAAARSDITDKPTLEDAMSVIEPLRAWCFFWDWDTSRHQVRWMTSWDTTDDDVERFARGVRAILAARN